MLVAETPLAGCTLPQSGTRLVCKSACRRSRNRRQQTRGFLRQQSVRAIAEPLVLPFEKESEHLAAWKPESWRQLKAQQQPNYQDEKKLREAVEIISRMPPLVFAGECRNLQARLAKCATGEAFLVQGRKFERAIFVLLLETLSKLLEATWRSPIASCLYLLHITAYDQSYQWAEQISFYGRDMPSA